MPDFFLYLRLLFHLFIYCWDWADQFPASWERAQCVQLDLTGVESSRATLSNWKHFLLFAVISHSTSTAEMPTWSELQLDGVLQCQLAVVTRTNIFCHFPVLSLSRANNFCLTALSAKCLQWWMELCLLKALKNHAHRTWRHLRDIMEDFWQSFIFLFEEGKPLNILFWITVVIDWNTKS